ncbi:MAG: hypothetical protein J5J00_14570 [Deltaproteobacteria bacterium]|nr:hypothetical protein [Deltaproteobacteria bacterium]
MCRPIGNRPSDRIILVIEFHGLGAVMDGVTQIRGSSRSNILQARLDTKKSADGQNLRSAQPVSDDAAIVDLSHQGAGASPAQNSKYDREDLGRLSERNRLMLATLAPQTARKYLQLLDHVTDERTRLQNFIVGVSEVLSKIPHSSLKPEPEDSEDANPLLIGGSLTGSVESQIEAAFASSESGPINVQKYAVQIDLQQAANNPAANQEDPIFDAISAPAVPARESRPTENLPAKDILNRPV